MAHDAFARSASMSMGATELAMSISEVQAIAITTLCICSSIAFACGFLMLVGFCLTLYESHRASQLSLNSLPLSYIIFLQRGYLLNQHLLNKWLIMNEDLSKYSSLIFPSFLTDSVGT